MCIIRSAAPLLLLLAACGGGGGGALQPAEPRQLDLGLVAGNGPTIFQIPVVNRFGSEAEITGFTPSAGFALASDQLPAVLAAGETADIDVRLVPAVAGPIQGTLFFRVSRGGQEDSQQTDIVALAEAPTASVTPGVLDFGDVLPGTSVDLPVTLQNTSQVSTIHLTGSVGPAADFSTPSIPPTIAPGASAQITVRYAPAGPGAPTGPLVFTSDAFNGPLSTFVSATSGGQEIVDFGSLAFDALGDTVEKTFVVPADAISFAIEASTDPGTELGLRLLTGPGGKEYENESLTGPYIWFIQPQHFVQQVPNTDRSDVQLVPGGGTYRLKLLRWAGSAPFCDVRVIIERRPKAGTDVVATLDLNVFLADAIQPTAATAEDDATLQTVLSQIDTILAQQGVRLGDVDYYDIGDPTYDDVTWEEFGPMLELSASATEHRLNLFFVRTAIGGGILGVSAALGGPSMNGTPISGVMSLYDTSNPTFIGLVGAHEVGHFVGLAHTVEQSGTHDDITDTAECPATGTDATCATQGGGYLMHWQAVGGSTVTDGQGLVIRGHPLMAPRLLPPAPLSTKPAAPRPVHVPAGVSADWCGTCRCGHGLGLKR